jgi:biopolymer transport protein TolQ
MNFFSGNPLWQLVSQADTISKMVLLTLLATSVICWAIFLGKLIIFRIKTKQFKLINQKLISINTTSDLITCANAAKNTAPGYFLLKNIAFLKEILKGNLDKEITEHEWELIEKNCDNTIETMILHDESYLSLLSSSAAVAPLLGLFGTVWGLIHAFMRISETQVADIATIAPGIAEALITTLAGLIVAIPALIMFNYLQTKTRQLEHHLFVLADRMIFILQHLRIR